MLLVSKVSETLQNIDEKKILFGKLQTKYLCVQPKEHKVQIVGSIVPSTS